MYAICYACDNNYILQVAVSISSLLKTNPQLCTHIFVFADNVTSDNQKKLVKVTEGYNSSIVFIDSSNILKRIKETGLVSNVDNSSLLTFIRLFIKDYIPCEYDTVLYFDADTLFVGSIRELFEENSKKAVSAVIDIMPQRYKDIIGFDGSLYFNCGILKINMDLWRHGDYEGKLLSYISSNKKKFLYGDQDLLNIILKDEIDVLPLKFNFFPFYGDITYEELKMYMGGNDYYSKEDYLLAQKNPAIIHLVYSVLDRPWVKGNINRFSEEWNKYVTNTEWKCCCLRKRKIYSRTRIMQLIYKFFGSKLVILLQVKRNNSIFSKIEKEYRRVGELS